MGASTHLGEKHHTPGGQDATLDAHTSTFQTALKKLSFMPSNALIPTRSITLCTPAETAPTVQNEALPLTAPLLPGPNAAWHAVRGY